MCGSPVFLTPHFAAALDILPSMGMQVTPARSAAFRILQEVAQKAAEPASLLHGRRTQKLQQADRDLATEIVYGVLRWQNRLDYILETHAKRPLKNVDFPLLLALRIGLYQIKFLSRVPERAAVNESVELARAFGPRGASGFVNGVMRSACRHPDQPPLPAKNEDALGYLTVTLSHPEWLARRYLDGLGPDRAEARCLHHNRAPSTDLRIEPSADMEKVQKLLETEGVTTEPFAVLPRCLRVRSGRPTASSLYRNGDIFIQEAGSQLIPYLLSVQKGDRVLDACAAPGSKATEISHWCRPGMVIALERRRRRLELMISLAKRSKCDNLIPVGADAEAPPFRVPFRRILLDAPCSSLGTLARNPDIKWRLSEKNLAEHAERQYRLLSSCTGLLAPGGRLVYSTCSTEREENEEVIQRFLLAHSGFFVANTHESVPESARHLIDKQGMLTTLPERDGMDGYFAVALEKK
jgi:16S rRNA (cytosine967-C5)-methyltransferase